MFQPPFVKKIERRVFEVILQLVLESYEIEDLRSGKIPVRMDKNRFELFVTQALKELPDEFQKLLVNIAIVIEDEPNEEQKKLLRLPRHATLYGLYQGVPKTTWGADQTIMPHKITIFQKPIERSFTTEEEIKEQVKRTVLHEIGHYFGLSEKRLQKLKKT